MTTGLVGLNQFRTLGLDVLSREDSERLRTSEHLLRMLQTAVAVYLDGPGATADRAALGTVAEAARLHLEKEGR